MLGVFVLLLVTVLLPHRADGLKISAFNIQVFGVSKMEDQFVVDIIIQVSTTLALTITLSSSNSTPSPSCTPSPRPYLHPTLSF